VHSGRPDRCDFRQDLGALDMGRAEPHSLCRKEVHQGTLCPAAPARIRAALGRVPSITPVACLDDVGDPGAPKDNVDVRSGRPASHVDDRRANASFISAGRAQHSPTPDTLGARYYFAAAASRSSTRRTGSPGRPGRMFQPLNTTTMSLSTTIAGSCPPNPEPLQYHGELPRPVG
jgi:hypothetical protein